MGVAFLLVVALNRALRRAGWYETRPEPDLLAWLDLVALGTVCDVVPLTGLNRALVAQGLKVMRRRGNIGLAALADVGRARPSGSTPITPASSWGRASMPAAGSAQSDLGARLLSTDDPVEARSLARRLDGLNGERREIEARVLAPGDRAGRARRQAARR